MIRFPRLADIGYTRFMPMRRILLRLLIAVFFLNASGLVFGVERLAGGGSHQAESAATARAQADCASDLAACKAHCQSHCAQHFTVLPPGAALAMVAAAFSAPPEVVGPPPTSRTSSLFRPPRTPTL